MFQRLKVVLLRLLLRPLQALDTVKYEVSVFEGGSSQANPSALLRPIQALDTVKYDVSASEGGSS